MDLRQLRSFAAVARFGSLTRAARELGITQPALGMQLRNLEASLGTVLLERHSRGVRLTEAGQLLAQRAREMLSLAERTRTELVDLAGEPFGTIRVGMSPSASLLLAVDLISAVAKQMPRVTLSLVEDSSAVMAEWLQLERIDLAFVFGISGHHRFDLEVLLSESLAFIEAGSERYGPAIPLAEVAKRRLILPGPHDTVRSIVDKAARDAGLRLDVVFEMQSVAIVTDLVARGYGSTILPPGIVERIEHRDTVTVRPIVKPALSRDLAVLQMRERMLSRAERRVVAMARRLARAHLRTTDPLWYQPPAAAAD